MSKQVQLMELLKKEVRSLLMTDKEGLTPAQLEEEYMAMIGKPLPVHDLGFQSTLELMEKMPEVVRICSRENGTFVLKAIADDTTKGIAKLVARQKRNVKTRRSAAAKPGAAFPCRNMLSSRCKVRALILPATVKAELQDLLSSSPLLLRDFNKAYFNRFGRVFQYTQHGFVSILEALKSVSDIVVVEQTKAGSLLTLRKYLASEIENEQRQQNGAWEEMPRAPAVEMPPLEPICEAKCFHLPAEEKLEPVETQAADLGDVLKQVSGWMSDLRDLDLKMSIFSLAPEIPPDAVQDRSLCRLPPLERLYLVGASVEHIISPGQFYIRVCNMEASDELQDMMFEMRHCYSSKLVSDRYIMPESSVQPRQLCCVASSKWWYRGIIHRVINDREVEVFYVDFGNLRIVQKSCLRFLKWCYLKLPAQAIPCSLAWVKPVGGTWSNDATLLFKKLCDSKLLVGIVDEYLNDVCYIFLCDTTTEDDVYFHTVLSNEGCADICRKNTPSQGFEELNPSALYLQPCRKQEKAEPVEPDLDLQQGSLEDDGEGVSSKLDDDELWEQVGFLAMEETEEDVWPLLEEASVQRTTDQDPEPAQEEKNERLTEPTAVVKTSPPLGESLVPVVLFKSVEEVYSSFTCSQQAAEMSQEGLDQVESLSLTAVPRDALHPAVLLMARPVRLDSPNGKEVEDKDLPSSPEVGLCSASGLPNQKSSLKLLVPPATLAAVFTAARLATSSIYFQWLPSLRKNM
ncbi:TDRD5 protein, partial [Centropus unirufus]|nr:TDRD5 protein [Centropus unirufus]